MIIVITMVTAVTVLALLRSLLVVLSYGIVPDTAQFRGICGVCVAMLYSVEYGPMGSSHHRPLIMVDFLEKFK